MDVGVKFMNIDALTMKIVLTNKKKGFI